MRSSGPTPRLLAIATSLCALALGCGDDEDGSGGSQPGCEPGFERDADGQCVPTSAGCATNELRSPRSGECLRVGWGQCPDGFLATADATSCDPVIAASCPPGTRPELGSESCLPVGFSDCPTGFAAGEWGCEDVLSPAPCTGATRDAVGTETCRPVGDCGAAFPPASATLFVDDSFTAGQLDATHFLTIGEAVAAAAPGDTIAVDSGAYAESLLITEAVTLVGKCPAEVVLQGNAVDFGIEVDGASDVVVRGLNIRGHHRGVTVRAGGSLELVDAIVEDNDNVGVLATEDSSSLVVRDSVVRGTQPIDGLLLGYGVDLNSGATIELLGTAVVDNHRTGVNVTDAGTSLTMTDSVIRATRTDATGDFGLAMLARQGANVTITESVFAENFESDIVALDGGTTLTVERSVLRDVESSIVGYGRGIDVETGAQATLTDVTLLRHREVGILASGAGTSVRMDRVTVDDTRVDAGGEHGTAVQAHDGGHVEIADCALVRSGDQAVFVDHPGTEIAIERSILTLAGQEAGTFGRGLSAFGGAHLSLVSSAVIDNREAGALVTDAGTQLTMTGSLLARTTGDAAGGFGRGLSVQNGAALQVSTSLLDQNREMGVIALGAGTEATLEHVSIRGTEPRSSDGAFGRGLMVQGGARAVVQGGALVDNTEVAGVASGAGTGLELRDVFVSGTRPSPAGNSGVALVGQTGAGMLLERVAVTDHRVAGLVANGEGTNVVVSASFIRGTQLGQADEAGFAHGAVAAFAARLSLTEVEVSQNLGIGVAFAGASGVLDACLLAGNAVGLHVQDGTQLLEVGAAGAGAPLEVQVTDTVSFVDNGTRFGAETLPMPDPAKDLVTGIE